MGSGADREVREGDRKIPFDRPRAVGKFLAMRGEKLYVRGVTYGGFRSPNGYEFPPPDVVERDFAHMAARGVNAVRTHRVPARSLLDTAADHGLYVMVGLATDQLIGESIDLRRSSGIEAVIRRGVRHCAGHPALLCYSVANEIPAPVVRWHGRRRTERLLARLYDAAKSEDPDGLVTYANHPSAEDLVLDFLDLLCFSVLPEPPASLSVHLARLQTLAGNSPLLIGAVGVDAKSRGEDSQAHVLARHIGTIFESGCAGAFAHTWTDDNGMVTDQSHDGRFGLTRPDRTEKPALVALHPLFAEAPFASRRTWPRISIVVCSYNGGSRIRECLEGIAGLDYPDYETIVVDDGSTDDTAVIVRQFDGVNLIRTQHGGLGRARNAGLQAATGEIIAYIDDDAYPDPHWLAYIAHTFGSTPHAGVGGPSIAPADGRVMSQCVANSPGNPVPVLLSDGEAEHLAGCNMAFRRSILEEIGGFDEHFRSAGDDVDACRRIRERGRTLGFNPAALVWHHPRPTIRSYWRQQFGYGSAEALLEAKWLGKYSVPSRGGPGGPVYGMMSTPILRPTGRVHGAVPRSEQYQAIYEPGSGFIRSLPRMPQFFLLILTLAGLSLLGLLWAPLLIVTPLLALAAGAAAVQAISGAQRARFTGPPRSRLGRARLRLIVAILHILQPLARLGGRLSSGLMSERGTGTNGWKLPRPKRGAYWTEHGRGHDEWLYGIEASLTTLGVTALRGGPFARFDLEVRGGRFGSCRLRMAVEEHGSGKQLVRIRSWPRWPWLWMAVTLLTAVLAVGAASSRAWVVVALLGGSSAVLAWRALHDCAVATAAICQAVAEGVAAVVEPTEQTE